MKRLRPQRGLTLSEVILVIGLLAVVVVALMTLFSQGLKALSHAQESENANAVARQLLEQVGPNSSDGTFDGNLPTPPVNGFPPAPYPAVDRDRHYVLVVRATALTTRLRQVRVEVQQGGRKIVELEKVVLR